MMKKISVLVFLCTQLFSCGIKSLKVSEELQARCTCEGSGSHTFVLDAGMGNWSVFYRPLFDLLKTQHRVCLIDRPGYGMSSVPGSVRDALTMAKEIEEALSHELVSQELILVGHSLGGLNMRAFQHLYPQRVAGLILLDAAHPHQFQKLPPAFDDMLKQQEEALESVIFLAKTGIIKFGKENIPLFGMPGYLQEDYYKVATTPEYYHTMRMEVQGFHKALEQVKGFDDLGDLPLLVVGTRSSMREEILPSAEKEYPYEQHNEVWWSLQEELSGLSSRSMLVESTGDHYLNLTDSKNVFAAIEDFYKRNY